MNDNNIHIKGVMLIRLIELYTVFLLLKFDLFKKIEVNVIKIIANPRSIKSKKLNKDD